MFIVHPADMNVTFIRLNKLYLNSNLFNMHHDTIIPPPPQPSLVGMEL